MSFLSPWWLLLALVGLLIVLLHLRRRTRRTQEVSSLYLWRRIAHDLPPQTPKEPPPLNPLLFLQLLFVLLLALALSQPIWGRLAQSQHTIYVLDASRSMQAADLRPSRFEAAKGQILREVGASGRVSLVVVNGNPYIAVARQQKATDLQTLIAPLGASDGPANWRQARPLLDSLQLPGERTRVVLYSDPQGLAEAKAALEGEGLELRVLGKPLPNLGFYDLSPQASATRPGLWRIEGHIANFAPDAKEIRVESWFHASDGTLSPLLTTQARLNPDQGAFFRLEVTPPGPGVVELRLPKDSLEADNHAFFNLNPPPKPRVLYLGPGNPALQKALLAVPGVEVFRANKLPADSNTYSLVIVDGVELERYPQTHTLWIGTSPTPGGAKPPKPGPLADPYPSGWQVNHPLSGSLDWSGVLLAKALDIPKLPGAEVLLEAGGRPLVQARTTPYGREVVLAFTLQDSNWPTQASFPVFVANLLRWAEPGLESLTSCTVGEPCGLEPRLLAGSWRLLDPEGKPVPLPVAFSQGQAQAPDPNLSRWLLRSLEHAFRPQRAGVYVLESNGLRYPIAVNAFFPQESDLREKNPSSGQNPGQAVPPQASSAIWPLWGGLLGLALLAVLLEGFLAGQGEGFLSLQNLRRNNPLARRRRAMLALQGLAALLLLLALLNPHIPFPLRERHSVVVADRPELYVGSAKERLEGYLGRAAVGAGAAGRGLVWLGEPPLPGGDLGQASTANPPQDTPGANLEASLSLAAAMLPPGAGNRVLLLADGTQTGGSFTGGLAQLVARGIPVDVVPVGGIPSSEVLVEQLSLPRIIHAGDTFLLQGIVYSQQPTPARLRVWRQEPGAASADKLWAEQAIQLQGGRGRVEATLREAKAGDYSYRLEVLAPADSFPQNNQAKALVRVQPATRVGLFSSEPAQAEILARALRVQGLEVRQVAPENLPKSLEEWAAYDVAVLMNLPVIKITSQQQKTLESWVRDQAGGLVILGGDSSFGPGGYYQTALDRLSPLSSKVPREAPRVAMLFVVDKSGSMNQPAGPVRRIDIAKEAVVGALDLLHPESLAGVVAFDTKPSLVVPMQSVRDRAGFAAKLSSLEPGGGTSIYPALEQALQTLQGVDAPGRHIVLLTDGLSTPGDFQGVVGRIVASGITLSTVAVGEGARLDLMENIARWGGGVAHATSDWQALPAILAQEALLQSKTPVKQEPFVPVWRDRSVSWLEGLPVTLPPLRAYVQTSAKPEALVHLLGPGSDPILASWRYGLGQVVAFSSQASGPWASEWLKLPSYPRLWAQVVHAVLPTTARLGLNPLLEREGNNLHLLVEAQDPKGEPYSRLNLSAEITPPTGPSFQLPLRETLPGRYEARFQVGSEGHYQVSVRAAETPIPLQSRPFSLATETPPLPPPVNTGFSIPYPPRYGFAAQGSEVLTAIAQVTGGRVLLGDEPLEPPAGLHWASWAAWPLLALLSLLCFLAALVLRYAPEFRWLGLRRRATALSKG